MNRFILEELEQITNKEQVSQIKNVLRLKEGCQIIGIKEGKAYLLEITELKAKEIICKCLHEVEAAKTELPLKVVMQIPLLKGEKTDWVIQKCSELGASEFEFINFEHSVKPLKNWEHKQQRWQKIINEAIEQCERVCIPTLKPEVTFKEAIKREALLKIAFVERLEAKNNLQELIKEKTSLKLSSEANCSLNLIFGPEGGFSEEEKNLLIKANYQFVSLGSRVLRSETAIIAGLNLIACFLDS